MNNLFINNSKDLWSDDYGQLPSLRTTVTGFSLIGEICGTKRYSIVEEFGGFSNLAVSIFGFCCFCLILKSI